MAEETLFIIFIEEIGVVLVKEVGTNQNSLYFAYKALSYPKPLD